tara:strand:+ start:157 stop:444 length:288 start_codon:yes stop_codon:yes gene_type:complete
MSSPTTTVDTVDAAPVLEPEPAPEPAPEPPVKKKREGVKMTEKQKKELTKHMAKSGLTGREAKSHRMSMMGQLRQGKSMKAAHTEVQKRSAAKKV